METLSTTEYLQRRPQPTARCTGSRPEQSKVSATRLTADGFLNHHFLPLYQHGAILPDQAKAEPQLFASLAKLQKAYSLSVMDVSDKPYPYNVLLAYWDTEKQIDRQSRDTELFIINEVANEYKFATKETLDTDRHLYYIPLLPLQRLMDSGREKRSAELLLSVCAYLYHGAGIPHYRDEESYLHYHYEMLTEDLDPAWSGLDKEDILLNKSALNCASHFGDVMQRRMYNPCHLEQMENRIKACKPTTSFQRDCLNIAEEALSLWQGYPDMHLFKNVDNSCMNGSEDEDDDYYDENNNTIAVYEYVHFVAEINGGIYQSLCEMVNCEFQEKMYTQEPAVITRFDDSLTGGKATLDYERRLFKLINALTALLDELP